jgi:flagellar biosynthesis protein FliR
VIQLTPVLRFGLLLVRPGMIMMFAPGFGDQYAPTRLKIGLTVLIAITLMPAVGGFPVGELLPLVLVVAREVAIGAAMALGIRILVAAAEFGGHLAGHQMGLSYGATVDPLSGARNPLLSVLFGNIALLTFLTIDGHHAVLRALKQSYVDLPVGMGNLQPALAGQVAQMLGVVFSLGMRLAAPVVLVLFSVEIGMALLARSAPALNLNSAAAPVRMIVGLLVLAVMVPAVASVAAGVANAVLRAGVQMAGAFR